MLVLTRNPGEKILIPSLGVEITLVEIKSDGRARIGVSAPNKALILREELTKRGKRVPNHQC